MSERPAVSRREVLTIGGSATLLPLASLVEFAGPVRRADASTHAAALNVLDHPQAGLLLSAARTLFPHDFLDDEQYMKIVVALDARAAADKGVASMLKVALAAFPDHFAATEETQREEYLRSLEGSPFFRLIYHETLVGLYGDPTVSRLLGYEGSSVEYGGYLQRGFDDISWLPMDGPVGK